MVVAWKLLARHYLQAKTTWRRRRRPPSNSSPRLRRLRHEVRGARYEYQRGELDVYGSVGNRAILEGAVRRVVPEDDLNKPR